MKEGRNEEKERREEIILLKTVARFIDAFHKNSLFLFIVYFCRLFHSFLFLGYNLNLGLILI